MIIREELRVRLADVVEPGVIGVIGTGVRIFDMSGHVKIWRIVERFDSTLRHYTVQYGER